MKSKSGFLFSFLFLATSLSSVAAHAWGDLGHQIVGEIAEERIAPATKDFVRGILGIEPIAIAANWPDHVRDDARFAGTGDNDFAPFHFAEVPTGFTYDTRLNKDPKDAFGAIIGAAQMLENSKSVPREKLMIALRYLVHVVGDIHQPLHVGNDYDRGGNACLVRYTNGQTGNFHSFWDDNMVTDLGLTFVDKSNPSSKAPQYYPQYVSSMKKDAPQLFNATEPVFTDTTVSPQVKSWIDQSAGLREKVYPDNLGGNPQAYKLRKYCQWYQDQDKGILGDTSIKSWKDIPNSDIPTLDQAYVDKFVKPVIEPQLIAAGVRLAGLLDFIAQAAAKNDPSANLVPDALQNQYIHEIQSELLNQ